MIYIPLFILYLSSLVSADTLVGCYSSIDGSEAGYYQYQTPSYCADQCPDSPYIAVQNGGTCYCLDSKPSSNSVSSSQCDVKCNGFGSEMCGGESTFSVYVGNGASSDDSSDSSSNMNSETSSSTKSSTTSSTKSSSSTSSTTSSSTTSSTDDDSTITSAPSTSSSDEVQVITTSSSNSEGLVIIKTVTKESEPTASSSSDSSDKDDEKKSSGSNTGAIVGGVVGGVVGLIAIGLLVFFLVRRKRNDDDDDDEEEYFDKPGLGGSINRNYGTGKSKKSVKTNGLDMPMTNPFTHPSDNAAANNDLVDPRLNPIMLGRRRLSEGSLADETDYSRKILQVANPE